jgi:hypothetical protein
VSLGTGVGTTKAHLTAGCDPEPDCQDAALRALLGESTCGAWSLADVRSSLSGRPKECWSLKCWSSLICLPPGFAVSATRRARFTYRAYGSRVLVCKFRRKGNVIGGVVLLLCGLVALSLSTDSMYPGVARVFAGVAAVGFAALVIRAWLPSVTVTEEQVVIRAWCRSARVERRKVTGVRVVDGSDGPIDVVRLYVEIDDERLARTHYQSPKPFRGGRTTATNRAADQLRTCLGLPAPSL